MSRIIITMSQTIFFRLLAHAPEDLQQEAKEDARRAIPAFCLTEDAIREKFAQEEQWEELSEESQKMAIQSLMDASEYDQAGKLANEAVTEAVGRYLHDAMLEKEQRQVDCISRTSRKRSAIANGRSKTFTPVAAPPPSPT